MRSQVHMLNMMAIHPFWRVVIGILALGLLGLFIVFGLVMLAVFAAMALVAGIVLTVRGWFFRRKGGPAAQVSETIDGEFTVVQRQRVSDANRED